MSAVYWITGLSGAGKTSLAREFAGRLRALGQTVVVLDGDELREVFGAGVTAEPHYGRAERLSLAFQYAHLCRVLASQGLTVVTATISLFREIHAWNRANLPGYFEIYLMVPMEVLRRRDRKGIYSRYDAGELNNVAGLDLAIDEPDAADWVVDYVEGRSVQALADDLMRRIESAREH